MATLEALKDLNGSARIDEILQRVIEREGFTDEQVEVRRSPDHHMGLLEYRLAWARNYLKNIGAIENSARGVWALTLLGRSVRDAEDVQARVKAYKAEYNKAYYEASAYANQIRGRRKGKTPPEPSIANWAGRRSFSTECCPCPRTRSSDLRNDS
jgi:restriction system protein